MVLIGKGITFDSGGISIKPLDGMKLMRKDMGGAAAVCGAVLGAADLGLPVRVTALAPMAENMISGAAMRPGDVVRHYGGLTTEVQNTDAEGRVVLGDALAYAVRRLRPDCHRRPGHPDRRLARGARASAPPPCSPTTTSSRRRWRRPVTDVGEPMWRLPLAEEYLSGITGGIADLNNNAPGPGALMAALFLREFTGAMRDRWAHIDMSAPSWIGPHRRSPGEGRHRLGRADAAALARHALTAPAVPRHLPAALCQGPLRARGQPRAAQTRPVRVGSRVDVHCGSSRSPSTTARTAAASSSTSPKALLTTSRPPARRSRWACSTQYG